MYRDFAFDRNGNFGSGDIHSLSETFDKESGAKETTLNTGCDELPKEYEEELLSYQLKPLLLTLRAIGCCPVETSKSGQ
jgi:hypothetical protein